MRLDHIEQVLGVLRTLYRDIPQEQRLRTMLVNLELTKGRPKKKNAEPREKWLEEARKFARMYIRKNGVVDIHIIRQHVPLPHGVDERATGGVLKHPDFVKLRDKPFRSATGRIKTIGEYSLVGLHEDDPPTYDSDDDDYGFVRFD